jgi:hypothetical protein
MGYLYVRESGENRGLEIDRWNTAAGAPLGSPYCAAFVSAMHAELGIPAVNSAWSPDWFSSKPRRIPFPAIAPGDVFGIFFPSKGRISHVGLVRDRKGSFLLTVEANTSPDAAPGSAADRDGQGVYSRRRPVALMKSERNGYSRYWRSN